MHGHRKQKTDWSRKKREGRRYDGGGNPDRQNAKPKMKWHENTGDIPVPDYEYNEEDDE